MRRCILTVLALLLTPVVVQAQDLTGHGQVAAVRGDQVEVRVNDPYEVSAGVSATIYTKNTVGGVEQNVPVAEMTVRSVSEGVVTGPITTRLAGIRPAEGFQVSFASVDVSSSRSSGRARLGTLALTSEPTGAEVTVRPVRAAATGRTIYRDQKSLGSTPVLDSLMPGRYRLTLRKNEYKPARRQVLVSPDSITADTVQLMERQGTVIVDARPDSATISIDGEQEGQGRVRVDVDEGEHTVRVAAPKHYPQTRTLSVRAEQERSVNIALEPRLGSLKIASTPDSAEVSIDGSTVGATPMTVEKPPGTYAIRIEAAHFKPSTHRVTVEAEKRTAIRAELQRPIEVRLADAHGPGVRKPRLERSGDELVVQYALRGEADEYDVTLRLSDERGSSFPTRLRAVRGHVGDDVKADTDRQLRWAVLDDYPRGLVGENYRLRIATDPDGGNAFLYVLGSILTGGGATAAVLMLQGGDSGDGGSSAGETGGIPEPPSPPD